jgi:DNA-binding NarL/FixJ family response regulator
VKKPRLIIADDHAVMVEGLVRILQDEFEIVATVSDGRKLVASAARLHPDVAIVDISMPSLNGIEAIRKLRKASPNTKSVILTMHADALFAQEAFEAGASAYVVKAGDCDELLQAISEVLRGRFYVTPRVAKDVLLNRVGKPTATEPRLPLTPRQREVLQLLVEGYSAKEIAADLNISISTVEFHKAALMRRLEVGSTVELVKYAILHDLAPAITPMAIRRSHDPAA